MCLYTRNRQPMVANIDIKCLKYVTKKDNQYYSPCRNTKIPIDQVMIASPSTPDINHLGTDYLNHDIYSLHGGAIHAKIEESPDCLNDCLVAIIPKGTEYWINPWGTEIAAKQMIITSKKGDKSKLGTSFVEDILFNAPEVNGIRIADYLLEDGTFVHPTKDIAKLKPIGIVVGFHNDKPLIGALEYMTGNMTIRDFENRTKFFSKQFDDWEEAVKDFDGKKWAKEISKFSNNNNDDAFNQCSNYRSTEEEEWYLPALGEIMTMLDNTLYLNAATTLTGVGFNIDDSGMYWPATYEPICYWSSSENYDYGYWTCSLGCDGVCCYRVGNYYGQRVVPFLSYKKKPESTETLVSKLKTNILHVFTKS